jgi:hypothetical protein
LNAHEALDRGSVGIHTDLDLQADFVENPALRIRFSGAS